MSTLSFTPPNLQLLPLLPLEALVIVQLLVPPDTRHNFTLLLTRISVDYTYIHTLYILSLTLCCFDDMHLKTWIVSQIVVRRN